MPIRFRCAYCNQLMGIASRKAGTVVRCPKCAGEIIVPVPEGHQPPEPGPEPQAGANPQAFEDLDIDQLINAPPEPANHDATAHSPAVEPTPPAPVMPEPTPMPAIGTAPMPVPHRLGFFVPLSVFFVAFGVVVLLLILVFVLGLIIGRHTALPPTSSSAVTEPVREFTSRQRKQGPALACAAG